ncbi:MAG: hypothetical protein HY560_01065 [Gemmatimonadetes bacterium]|nr:hypothetical protein [Gemmatimonadota bacterium]
MKATPLLVPALLLGTAAAGLSCADPNTPVADSRTASPRYDLTGELQSLSLLKCSPLPSASTTQTVGSEGGELQVGPHTLTIAPQSLTQPVTITAEAPSDTVNHIHFEPAGLVFSPPARLTMSYANCNTLGSLLPKHVVYTTDALVILEVLKSFDDPVSETVTGKLEHFSEYAIAW